MPPDVGSPTPFPGPVRSATLADVPTLVRFNACLALETERKRLDLNVLERGVRRVLERPDLGRYFLAEESSQTVGQALVTYEWSDWRDGLIWWLQSVYVEPAFRRRGVFRAIYAELLRQAAAEPDVCGVRLYVEQDNSAAQQTYARLGMRPAGYQVYESLWPRTGDAPPAPEA